MTQTSAIKAFITTLKCTNFQGDIEDSYGARIVASTDNSVYQVIPDAILYPRVSDDINHIVKVLAENPKLGLSLVARGGGTGTNGQSLNQSLILDTSRYLNKIIKLDIEKREVVVEPGVVLDQLNTYLSEHQLFFPPDVSSSSRATLGGMVATDASGKGSRVYGKTSDYINAMDVVLSDGSDFRVESLPFSDLDSTSENSLALQAQQKVFEVISQNRETIEQCFPKMNRGLTGYNLEHVITDNNKFKLSYLLAGSEGTLALSKRLTLRLISKPKKRALIAVLYKNFDHALDHIPELLKAEPTAIEVLDDKVLMLAQKDAIWQDVQNAFSQISNQDEIKGLNFIEITADTDAEILTQAERLKSIIKKTANDFSVIDHLLETRINVITGLWGIRKRAVGLLGALEGERRPTAFVEDTAVPPENLPAFIRDFRAVLDHHGLDYGMYGHADVGCLHVRPALDMRQQSDQLMIRSVTDEVAKLAKQYGGLLWGEHGKGYRGEYSPLFFGEALYPLLEEIKTVFDPNNIFNPGKLAAPKTAMSKTKLIDEIPFRGASDAEISSKQADKYRSSLYCNGNGACFSWDVSEAMCPSYKATKDKRFSPKGRAAMLREWLRLSEAGDEKVMALEEELFESLDACLSCKSCTHSCPIKVDIPELKSLFLETYYKNRKRPVSDKLFAHFETLSAIGRKAPSLVNVFSKINLFKKYVGIDDLPQFSKCLERDLRSRGAKRVGQEVSSNPEKTVILLPDSFNASFDSQVLLAAYDVLSALGFSVLLAPIFKNGKVLHVKGYRAEFAKTALIHIESLEQLSKMGLPLISVEVVTRLMHSKEYPEILKRKSAYNVVSIESWLLENKAHFATLKPSAGQATYTLLPHCMEQTVDKQSFADWQILFDLFNISLDVKVAGCCGMSGLFGHEKQNKKMADKIFNDGWQKQIENKDKLLATGFSCRCQLRNHGEIVKHPIQILAQYLAMSN